MRRTIVLLVAAAAAAVARLRETLAVVACGDGCNASISRDKGDLRLLRILRALVVVALVRHCKVFLGFPMRKIQLEAKMVVLSRRCRSVVTVEVGGKGRVRIYLRRNGLRVPMESGLEWAVGEAGLGSARPRRWIYANPNFTRPSRRTSSYHGELLVFMTEKLLRNNQAPPKFIRVFI